MWYIEGTNRVYGSTNIGYKERGHGHNAESWGVVVVVVVVVVIVVVFVRIGRIEMIIIQNHHPLLQKYYPHNQRPPEQVPHPHRLL
jgi:hypothetical protein